MKAASILLLEESPLFRSAFATTLRRLGFFVTTYELSQQDRNPGKDAHAVLFDVVTFAGAPPELEQLIKRFSQVAPVLLLARDDRVEDIVKSLRAGAVGFVKQTASIKELRNAILCVATGGIYCDPRLFKKIVKYLPALTDSKRPALTRREEEVLRHVSLGQTNKEIAQHLGLAEQSIKVYVSNLLRKTATSNRSSLVTCALTRGLLESR